MLSGDTYIPVVRISITSLPTRIKSVLTRSSSDAGSLLVSAIPMRPALDVSLYLLADALALHHRGPRPQRSPRSTAGYPPGVLLAAAFVAHERSPPLLASRLARRTARPSASLGPMGACRARTVQRYVQI